MEGVLGTCQTCVQTRGSPTRWSLYASTFNPSCAGNHEQSILINLWKLPVTALIFLLEGSSETLFLSPVGGQGSSTYLLRVPLCTFILPTTNLGTGSEGGCGELSERRVLNLILPLSFCYSVSSNALCRNRRQGRYPGCFGKLLASPERDCSLSDLCSPVSSLFPSLAAIHMIHTCSCCLCVVVMTDGID